MSFDREGKVIGSVSSIGEKVLHPNTSFRVYSDDSMWKKKINRIFVLQKNGMSYIFQSQDKNYGFLINYLNIFFILKFK
jgi:hypothetical protein